MKKLVIFDLDGTLLNTIGDLAACCNLALEKHSLPTHSDEEYASFVGNGILRLVERAIPEQLRTDEFVAKVRADFVSLYTANICAYTTPYPDIVKLLDRLQHNEIALAVASNKFQAGCDKLVKHFFGQYHFSAILGQRPNIPLKPSPDIIREIMQRTGYTPDKILFVGDSGVDILTAAAAGVDSVGVTWGFRSREELAKSGAKNIIDSPLELLAYI